MILGERVDFYSRSVFKAPRKESRHTMWASGGAAIRIITKSMDMEGPLSIGIVTADVP